MCHWQRLFAIAFFTACLTALAPSASAQSSTHREHMIQYGATVIDVPEQPPPQKDFSADPIVEKIVYGYYPYWVSGYDELNWELLTHVAWFAVSMGSDGSATNTNGWPSSWTGLVDTAHANNVRVDVTFTLFSGSGIDTLVNSAANRANAISTIIDAIDSGNADGAAIDFEGVPASAATGFETFLSELRAEMDLAGLTDKQISVAGPAVDWSGAFDLAAILPSIDIYFIMGYGYFWSGSGHAGPTGILLTDDFWRTYTGNSQLRTMADYGSQVSEVERAKIVMGVPYYGREWTTDGDSLGAATYADVGSVTYSSAMNDLADPGISRLWDDHSLGPWYAFQDGVSWHQVYYDDEESLAWKYRLVNEQGLGGIGIWALRYDGDHTALWDEIEAAFAGDFTPHEGDKDEPIPVTDFPFDDNRDTSDHAAGGCFFNFYSGAQDVDEWGREFVYRVEICHDGELMATVDGDGGGVDNDVHILTDLSQNACVARGNNSASFEVSPGTYYVVVDTYVDDAVLQGGPFDLLLEGIGIPNPQCPEGLVCEDGECIDPDEEPDGGDDTDAGDDSGCYEVTEKVNTCGCNLPGSEPRLTTLFPLLLMTLH